MKKLWNYIFYSTWKTHKIIGEKLFEKPLKYILSYVAFFSNNLKKGEAYYRNFVDNKEMGFNIMLAYRCMLSTTMILLAGIEICVFFLFNLEVYEDVNIIYFFSTFIFSYFLNELLLGVNRDKYINYFIEFEKNENSKMEYVICFLFHLGAIVFCISAIIFFDV